MSYVQPLHNVILHGTGVYNTKAKSIEPKWKWYSIEGRNIMVVCFQNNHIYLMFWVKT